VVLGLLCVLIMANMLQMQMRIIIITL